jgi:hypothetical protein
VRQITSSAGGVDVIKALAGTGETTVIGRSLGRPESGWLRSATTQKHGAIALRSHPAMPEALADVARHSRSVDAIRLSTRPTPQRLERRDGGDPPVYCRNPERRADSIIARHAIARTEARARLCDPTGNLTPQFKRAAPSQVTVLTAYLTCARR